MDYITLQEARKVLPGNPCYRTVWKRARKGLLKAVWDGTNWYTTREWCEDFLREQTNKRLCVPDIEVRHVTLEWARAALNLPDNWGAPRVPGQNNLI